MTNDWIYEDVETLIYIGDPLCSWCYGIAPSLSRLKEEFSEMPFKLIMGGLRPYNDEKITTMAEFLKGHWVEVQERSQQPFRFEILKDPNFIYDTEPPSRAILVVRKMNPTLEFEFFKAVQRLFYYQNLDTNLLSTYSPLLDEFRLDRAQFEELFNDDNIKTETRSDFKLSQSLGIRGFPSIVYKKGEQFTLIANGYETAENMIKRVQHLR